MAAVRQNHHRRTPSNPFADAPSAQQPPPPPPKSAKHSSKHSRPSSARMASRPPDIVDAVRDTVIFKSNQDPPRNRPGRSQTAVYVLRAFAHALLTALLIRHRTPPSGSLSRAPQRRSHSQDSGHAARQQKTRSAKKGSRHADVIDRLDYTGVGLSAFSAPPPPFLIT